MKRIDNETHNEEKKSFGLERELIFRNMYDHKDKQIIRKKIILTVSKLLATVQKILHGYRSIELQYISSYYEVLQNFKLMYIRKNIVIKHCVCFKISAYECSQKMNLL